MALPDLKTQLNNFVLSMLDEGMIDGQYFQIQALQDESNPQFVTEVIISYCNNAERIITELNTYLSQQIMEFDKMDFWVHQLKGSSCSMGAKSVKNACIDFLQASEGRNKAVCLQALNTITHEYCLLRSKFETIIQLEENVRYCDRPAVKP